MDVNSAKAVTSNEACREQVGAQGTRDFYFEHPGYPQNGIPRYLDRWFPAGRFQVEGIVTSLRQARKHCLGSRFVLVAKPHFQFVITGPLRTSLPSRDNPKHE